MNEAIARMISKYECNKLDDYLFALREILQEVALLGLWRSKFFEKAAFYGVTSLRILYGLDRFSEDLDFSLLKPSKKFEFDKYALSLEKELKAFGFDVRVVKKQKTAETQIRSAFLKLNTFKQLILIKAEKKLSDKFLKDRNLR